MKTRKSFRKAFSLSQVAKQMGMSVCMPILALVLILGGNAVAIAQTSNAAPVGQDFISQAESLILQASQQGNSFSSDEAKRSTKKGLEQAEKLLKEGLKRDPECEKCAENLVATYFYKSTFRFAKNYDQCTKSAAQGLARFPSNSRMAYYKGYAHYINHEYGEATKALSRYLRTGAGDPLAAEVRELLQNSQQRFLSDWYRQADFYESPASRIEVSQFFQKVTLFQFTPTEEQNFGDQAFNQLVADAPQIHDPEIQAYLEKLVSELTSRTPGPPFKYDVVVIKSPEVNAFASPGHVVVSTGLLSFVDSESQLVGALAHELSHTYAHHTARKLIADFYTKAAVGSLIQAINPQSQGAQVATFLAANIGLDLLSRAYGRYEEKEADLYATHIMFNAGFNPTGLSSFFLEKYKQNPKQGMKFLRTHPPDQDRAAYLTNYLESFPLDREMRVDSEAFQKIKAKISRGL